MSEPVSIPSRPPLARSLLISLSVTFAACLIAFGLAVHFLIVAPATQSLARFNSTWPPPTSSPRPSAASDASRSSSAPPVPGASPDA
jgi:hypothetical protein